MFVLHIRLVLKNNFVIAIRDITEKPDATTVAEAEEMKKTAETQGLTLMAIRNNRFALPSKYLKEKVKVEFDGIERCESFIVEARDEATGLTDEVLTRGSILTINGTGIKIEGDEEHKDEVGVFFCPSAGSPVKASIIALNNPKTLIVQIPNELTVGESYRLAIETQSSARHGACIIKKVRDIRSDFTLVAA